MGSKLNHNQRKILVYRGYTDNASLSATEWLPPSQFQTGIDQAEPTANSTELTKAVPISSGTVCDNGENTLTGSVGGDNSTNNTTRYKEGANLIDNTAQNLIANDTEDLKIWTIGDLTTAGANADATKFVGLWLYINDQDTLDKFLDAGTCLELRLGVDSTTNYYSKEYEKTDLSIGWNWLSDNELLSTWTETGTPGTLNDFQIRITTNNATDEFVAGDVVYDLLRQWEESDLFKDFSENHPSINIDLRQATTRCYLNSIEATGFNLSGLGSWNKDSTKLLTSLTRMTPESKGPSDEFAFIEVDRVV